MLALRKFLRWTFGVQAIVFGSLAVMLTVRHASAHDARQAVFNIALPVVFAVISALFAKAWLAAS